MKLKIVVEDINSVPEAFRSLYEERDGKWILTGVEGMKTQEDVDNLQAALGKERLAHKETKAKLGVWGDMNYDEVREQLDRVAELEAASKGKLNDDDINKIVEQRLATRTAPLTRDLEAARAQLAERDGEIANYKNREQRRLIQEELSRVAGAAKVLPSAIEDIQLYAGMFTVDETGRVVTNDNAKVGGLTAKQWLDDLIPNRPHWFPPSQGGGAGGSGSGGTGSNPWSKDSWNMTEQMRVFREDPSKAERLAKSAGTSVGGPRPA